MAKEEPTYLGDGIYASGEYMITLSADRGDGKHYVCLEPATFDALIKYAMKISWLKEGQVLR